MGVMADHTSICSLFSIAMASSYICQRVLKRLVNTSNVHSNNGNK